MVVNPRRPLSAWLPFAVCALPLEPFDETPFGLPLDAAPFEPP